MLHAQQELAACRARIADLEARSQWLEGQSSDARRALAAVENGRVLRILRRLSRAR
jgi:BMFP domain-containing protein YqiC